MARFDRSLLQGRWLHAHEEDQPGQAVFRPASHPLPPARGRTGYDFHADGRVTAIGSGPTDRSATAQGSWTVDDQGRVTVRIPGQPDQVLEVTDVGQDRLVVKK